MNLVTLDFETYYSQTYSLSKLTTEAYVNDPQFQIIGFGLQVNDQPSRWFSSPRPADYARALAPLADSAVICHNMPFDGAILSWRLGIRPRFLIDTLSMARALYGNHVSNSLDALTRRLGVGIKGHEVQSALGKRLEDFSPSELAAYGGYCRNDVQLTRAVFDRMRGHFSAEELRKMDIVLRMYTDPVLRLDKDIIRREIELETTRKAALLQRLGGLGGEKGANLSSNDKFASLLKALGVEPPTKLSPKQKNEDGSPKRVWAFAKGDADFRALLDHDDAMVQAAVEARLGIKSTQKQTRATRFLEIAERNDCVLPMPLSIAAAHTQRLGGWDGINVQNLPRVSKGKPDSGLLRKSIIAPPGHMLVVGDLSQIEARLLALQAQQTDKLDAFAAKRDVYSEQASVIYGRPVDRKKNADDFVPGFIGKAVVLGCGYSMGYLKFGSMIYVGMLGEKGILFDDAFAATLGVDPAAYAYWVMDKPDLQERAAEMKPLGLTPEQWTTHLACARHIINAFRESNPAIAGYWKICQQALEAMYAGREFAFGGPDGALLRVEGTDIVLPSGMRLQYPELQRDEDGGFSCLRRKEGRVQRVRVYGGNVTENCTQALAAIVIGSAMTGIDRRGWRVALQVHDEVVAVVPEADTDYAVDMVRQILCTAPRWAPHMPLAADVSAARSYGEAK